MLSKMVLYPSTTINCRGKLLDLSSPKIMAIVNLSPDSFYHSVDFGKPGHLMVHVENCVTDGAEIIDLGGMSTRPGSKEISVEEEWNRIKKPLWLVRKTFQNKIVSVDTYRSEIVRRAYDEGVDIVNDVSGGAFDPDMFRTVAKLGLPYILMHNRAKPDRMQEMTDYEDLISEMYDYFIGKMHLLEAEGVLDIIIDPGFGFAKTIRQNYTILKNLETFKALGYPLLVGVSRKSMFYKLLDTAPEKVLGVTTAMHFKSLEAGASILRVHDVKEAAHCIRVFEEWKKA